MAVSEPNKIIYSMLRVSKFHDKKPILKDISLSYFYGAKIGVLGLNGSGKSSLLKILAGEDKTSRARPTSPRIHHRLTGAGAPGRLRQDRARGVEEGAAETVALLAESRR
jgi:ATPase subunit of ABC transporter with duplicated ATPase domains